ncbi:nickel insertion protein [Sediminitomix flava]|uniref:Uncharacterized protein DUF111 n=1 Tax=Sediminitomix flava TaxID=379075 RepID=A0A315ZTG6_SEDFL|nr:nickel insertion protein [Sediminitomix flava]PWJ38524.1 uncharacterized protein DUF111 [Sediminitomix flava]
MVSKKDNFNQELKEEVVVSIKYNIDHSNGEFEGNAFINHILTKGALDVSVELTLLENGDQAFKVEVLCYPEKFGLVSKELFIQSSTKGMKYAQINRLKLPMEIKEIHTKFGVIQQKNVTLPSGKIISVLEKSILQELAQKNNISIEELKQSIK